MLALFVNSEGRFYFNHTSLKSTTSLNFADLKNAWKVVIHRNEILRTGFCHVADERFPFAMVTYRSGVFEVPWQEHCDAAGDQALLQCKAQAGDAMLSQLHRPPWHLIAENRPSETILHLSAVHALYDHHSLNLILSEVSQLCQGGTLPDVTPISPILSSILEGSLSQTPGIWEDLANNIRVTKFPDLNPVHSSTGVTQVYTKTCSHLIPPLQAQCRDSGISLQAAGQAAWARLLASYLGESDVAYGVVLSGRTGTEEAQDAIFPCITTVPACHSVEGRSNLELTQHIMSLNAALVKGQFMPLSKIQRIVGSNTALFDTLFAYQKFSPTKCENIWTAYDEKANTDVRVTRSI